MSGAGIYGLLRTLTFLGQPETWYERRVQLVRTGDFRAIYVKPTDHP